MKPVQNDLYGIVRHAHLSDDGRYRYRLDRQWAKDAPFAVWVMLNPSIADAEVDDATIRALYGFARHWGHGGFVVVNLFARRATDPRVLYRLTEDDATGGERNDLSIGQACLHADRVIAAWGAHGRLYGRDEKVMDMLDASGVELYCLGKNSDGTPRHPLYVKRATPFVALSARHINLSSSEG